MSTPPADRDRRIADLEARLNRGWALLESGQGTPDDIARWEAAWLRMLALYEAAYDERRDADG